jgi:FMN phosphatase YigB (HAD superfamily)
LRSAGPTSAGMTEPDRRAFQCALDQWLKPPNTVLYVDDNETNLVVASEMGMSTLLATPTGRWEREVDRWIECWVGEPEPGKTERESNNDSANR